MSDDQQTRNPGKLESPRVLSIKIKKNLIKAILDKNYLKLDNKNSRLITKYSVRK